MNRENLIRAGVDYDQGLHRFAGNAPMYEKYLKQFFETPWMEQLTQTLAAGDRLGAFRVAHDLKGTSGNLSLNAFYGKICELTELLRQTDADCDYQSALTAAEKQYDEAKAAVKRG